VAARVIVSVDNPGGNSRQHESRDTCPAVRHRLEIYTRAQQTKLAIPCTHTSFSIAFTMTCCNEDTTANEIRRDTWVRQNPHSCHETWFAQHPPFPSGRRFLQAAPSHSLPPILRPLTHPRPAHHPSNVTPEHSAPSTGSKSRRLPVSNSLSLER
jgi:hypothetical protein